MSGMDGMVNAELRSRVTRNLREYRTYDGKRREAADAELGDDAEAIVVAEDSVQSIVGYLLLDLRRLNKNVDSLALERTIHRTAASLGLEVGDDWFRTKQPVSS